MEIGAKIKKARLSAGLTQEHAAEALGVSRQTISNWENCKTYPDIVSVIKMSDLYSISLDRLLKEQEEEPMSDYINYLSDSTNTVKSRTKLGKIIIIATYLAIWTFTLMTYWWFMSPSDMLGFSLIFLVIALPVSTFVLSILIGANNFWGKKKWISAVVFGVMYMLAEYLTASLGNMLYNSYAKFNMPDFSMILIGGAVSVVGLFIGSLIHRFGRGKER